MIVARSLHARSFNPPRQPKPHGAEIQTAYQFQHSRASSCSLLTPANSAPLRLPPFVSRTLANPKKKILTFLKAVGGVGGAAKILKGFFFGFAASSQSSKSAISI